jgi:hypothetical protein
MVWRSRCPKAASGGTSSCLSTAPRLHNQFIGIIQKAPQGAHFLRRSGQTLTIR